ncbi:tRNA (guanosine(46)-N7)-methyltransferase TrmB [Leifsonia poae]|uniref:tRNA (guanosine(46)-N7)-methyltransferase TrmB n=1 Tax=Leifsonia poae TaxID=110933 RepID=UPI001CBDA3E9|nr:tRNA (guanosine(46)-N7)-methyltransferase TrmB [Leifsonia poae]
MDTPNRQRSFVSRGRRTEAQQRALEELWPDYGIDFVEERIDLDRAFGRVAPRIVEIGFGNGENLLTLAAQRPETDFLGVEVHGSGVGRLLNELSVREIGNVRVVRHDAVEVLERMLPEHSLDEVLIFFPDPWPKNRHRRRRLVQPEFALLLARSLKPTGTLRLATDWADYAEHMIAVLDACPELVNSAGAGGFVPRPDDRALTRFEQRGERLGHAIVDLEYRTVTHP